MLSKKMEEALNAQVNTEFWSALFISFDVQPFCSGWKSRFC